jgi:hypothetical protein
VAHAPTFASGKWIGGLSVYALALLVCAYAAASAERGVALPWNLFFAPLSAASYWVSWDGPETPTVTMFFGAALWWPLVGVGIWLSPDGRRGRVARAALVLHYLSGVWLAGSSLNRFQWAALGVWLTAIPVGVGIVVYLAGQVAIWRGIRRLPKAVAGRAWSG